MRLESSIQSSSAFSLQVESIRHHTQQRLERRRKAKKKSSKPNDIVNFQVESHNQNLAEKRITSTVLADLVRNQKALQISGRFEGFIDNPLAHFINDELALEVSREYSLHERRNRKSIVRRIRGKLFEQLSYGVMSSKQDGDKVVISPHDTLTLFTLINPDAKKTHNGRIQRSLMGVYVPDGLLVDSSGPEPKVLKAFEYTKTPEKRIEGFYGIQNSIRSSEALFTDTDICLVHPILDDRSERYVANSGVQRLEIPVDYDELELAENEILGV